MVFGPPLECGVVVLSLCVCLGGGLTTATAHAVVWWFATPPRADGGWGDLEGYSWNVAHVSGVAYIFILFSYQINIVYNLCIFYDNKD